MLKQRIITAIILIPAVLSAIFMLPAQYFTLVMALVVLIAAWEWANIIGLVKTETKLAFLALIVLVQSGVFLLTANVSENTLILDYIIMGLAFFWWCIAFFLVVRFPDSAALWSENTALKALMGVLVLIPAWLALSHLQSQDPWWLMYVMGIVWGADTGAYFVGRKWGQRKLAIRVSPGKSIEGVLGGLSFTLILAILVAVQIDMSLTQGIGFLLLTGFVCLVSVLGDLLESMMKRQRGIKDSGHILPGHGGILDRIDSLTAAAPVFLLGKSLLF